MTEFIPQQNEDSNVMIIKSKNRGNVLVARRRLEPTLPFGFPVLIDKALLVMPTPGSSSDDSGDPPEILKPGPDLWTDWYAFCQQPEAIRIRVLSLYTDMECPHAIATRKYLLQSRQKRAEDKRDDDDDDEYDKGILNRIEEFVRFTMVIRFNSVELNPPKEDGSGPGVDYGHGLFEIACRMNHSCKPNCVWMTTQDGKAKEVRAILPIEEGEELTVDYVGEVLKPIPFRRKELLQTKGFSCKCNRCSASFDDTRRFRCVEYEKTGCKGVHFLVQDNVDASPKLLACSYCATNSSADYLQTVLDRERFLTKEIDFLDNESVSTGDIESRIEKLVPPHELHCLAEKCFQLQGELFSERGNYVQAAEAYARQLKCRTAILGSDYHNQASAFCCERLGDALVHVNLEEAEEAYKRTVRHIQLLRGGIADPYSRCAVEKLMHVQHCLVKLPQEAIPSLDRLHGITAEVPDPSFDFVQAPCAMCGNPAFMQHEKKEQQFDYCCEQHMDLHQSLLYSKEKDRRIESLALC